MPRIGQFLVAMGVLFILWGVASWFTPAIGDTFSTDVGYRIFYLLLGIVVTWSGITWNPDIRNAWSSVLGALFLALAILGFAVAGRGEPNAWVFHLENPVDNVVHLVLGLLFLVAGLAARTDEVYSEPSGTTMNYR